MPFLPKRAPSPGTSSISVMASGRKPIRMRSRGSSTTCTRLRSAGRRVRVDGMSEPLSHQSPDSPASFAKTAGAYFLDLQARIVAAFEGFETSKRFEHKTWSRPEGHRLRGGGEMRTMRGDVF